MPVGEQECRSDRRARVQEQLSREKPVLHDQDPLFGVLRETQVGVNPLTGRPRIAEEVLEEMKRYMMADTGEDRAIKVNKVIKSVKQAEEDPNTQRSVLRLEAPPPSSLLISMLIKGGSLITARRLRRTSARWLLSSRQSYWLQPSKRVEHRAFLTTWDHMLQKGVEPTLDPPFLTLQRFSISVLLNLDHPGLSERSTNLGKDQLNRSGDRSQK